MIRWQHSRHECGWCQVLLVGLVVGRVGQGEPAAVEDVQAEVAAAIGPLILLHGEDGADEPDVFVAPTRQYVASGDAPR